MPGPSGYSDGSVLGLVEGRWGDVSREVSGLHCGGRERSAWPAAKQTTVVHVFWLCKLMSARLGVLGVMHSHGNQCTGSSWCDMFTHGK